MHYKLYVFTNGDKKDVEKLLKPFEECFGYDNNFKMKFENETRYYKKRYKEKRIKVIVNGKEYEPYNDLFRKTISKEEWEKTKLTKTITKKDRDLFRTEFYIYDISGYKTKKTTMKEKYKSFKKYMEEYWKEKKDQITKKYGYWKNPQGYWDWYIFGGRWGGECGQKIKDINFEDYKTPYAFLTPEGNGM